MLKYITMIMIPLILSPFDLISTTPGNEISAEKTIALTNAMIIDGNGSSPIIDGTLLIRGEKIISNGNRNSISIPPEAYIMDLTGYTLLPGFFNAHVHQGYIENNLRAWAHSGVTTVRELGTQYSRDLFSQRNHLLADNRNARLISAGPLLTVPKGYPIAIFEADIGLPIKSLKQLKKKITTILDEGADIIKISMESGQLWRKNLPVFTDEQLKTIVSLGHQRGKKVSAHLLSSRDVVRAVSVGIDDIAHMVVSEELDEALIKQVIKKNISWIPTMELYTFINPRYLKQALKNLHNLHLAGARIALGTDYGGYTSTFQLGMPLKEMQLMEKAGMSPMEIIMAATVNAAFVCGVDHQLGSLENGKIADVIAVKGNPLNNINIMKDVHLVIKNGSIIRNDL